MPFYTNLKSKLIVDFKIKDDDFTEIGSHEKAYSDKKSDYILNRFKKEVFVSDTIVRNSSKHKYDNDIDKIKEKLDEIKASINSNNLIPEWDNNVKYDAKFFNKNFELFKAIYEWNKQISEQRGGNRGMEEYLQPHINMYILKFIRVLVYRYFLQTEDIIQSYEYIAEVFVNMIVLYILQMQDDSRLLVGYFLDTLTSLFGVFTYLRIVEKESWTVDKNIVSGILLFPYYFVIY